MHFARPGYFILGVLLMDRFNNAGLALQPTFSTNYLETIGMLVSVGLGWSVLPQSMKGDLTALEVNCEPIIELWAASSTANAP